MSGPAGTSSGTLLRGAEVVAASRRRGRGGRLRPGRRAARGPGNLGGALGAVLGTDDGTSLLDGSGPFSLALAPGLEARITAHGPAQVVEELLQETVTGRDGAPVARIARGPRTGVGGIAGGARSPGASG